MLYNNILLIDDDREDSAVFLQAVQSLSRDIICRVDNNTVKAIENLRDSVILPDLLFLDLNMPAVSGLDFRRRLRDDQRLKDIPVILYSNYSKEAAEQLSLINDSDQFISKPHSYEAMVEILRNIIKP